MCVWGTGAPARGWGTVPKMGLSAGRGVGSPGAGLSARPLEEERRQRRTEDKVHSAAIVGRRVQANNGTSRAGFHCPAATWHHGSVWHLQGRHPAAIPAASAAIAPTGQRRVGTLKHLHDPLLGCSPSEHHNLGSWGFVGPMVVLSLIGR